MEALGRRARRSQSARRIGMAAASAILAAALVACGPARDPIEASSDAATACRDLSGLESGIVNHQISTQTALQTINDAKSNADTAAHDDPRWKRLDSDVNAVRTDLLANRVVRTIKVKAIDAAAICSPLGP